MKNRVLVCDDDEPVLEVTKTVLELKGYEVKTLSDCTDIIDTINEFHPSMILMDLGIPPNGGEEATEILKSSEEGKNIPVIIFSANNDIEKITSSSKADDYLSKPFDISKLEEIVEKYSGK